MAKKKKVQRRAKRKVSRKQVKSESFSKTDLKKKITIVINNLLLFVALSLVSFVLYRFLQNDILVNLFQAMSMIFGFVSVAFLITLLVLIIMKFARKK